MSPERRTYKPRTETPPLEDCQVEVCDKPTQTRGYCGSHYHRLVRYGDPLFSPVPDYSNTDMSLYNVWAAMKRRCDNKNTKSYPLYGGRGIWVCQGWRESYKKFVNDMGVRPKGMTLDRKDNDSGYTCGSCDDCLAHGRAKNVVWESRKTQARNTRKNRYITVDGVSKTIAEWTEVRGFKYAATIWDRLRRGWTERDAVMTPVKDMHNSRKEVI